MKYIKFFLLISIINLSKLNDDIIDITQYEYPKPIDREDEYNIAIFGTNDIHGAYFPSIVNLSSLNITYYSGGLEYMGKYSVKPAIESHEHFIKMHGIIFMLSINALFLTPMKWCLNTIHYLQVIKCLSWICTEALSKDYFF